jgi:hypothetical protein
MEILMRLQGGNLLHGSLLVGLYVLTGTQLSAQGPGATSVSGIVVASDRSPLPDAILGIERNGQVLERVRSGSDGQFTFAAISAGPASITIRRLGYQQKRMEVNIENATTRSPLQIELAEVPSDVETVIIEGETGRLQEFTDRRARNNFGYFFDQNDIRKKSPRFVSELFRAIPGARLQASRRTGNILELRNCTPRIWIDAVRAENAEIDELIGPSEIAGMEIYPSFAGVPAQYMDRESRACGVVLVWTRQK